eukprot:3760657-Rhodomonas_salina.2
MAARSKCTTTWEEEAAFSHAALSSLRNCSSPAISSKLLHGNALAFAPLQRAWQRQKECEDRRGDSKDGKRMLPWQQSQRRRLSCSPRSGPRAAEPPGVENHCHAAQGVVWQCNTRGQYRARCSWVRRKKSGTCPLRALGDMVLCQIKVVLHGTHCHCFLKQRLPLAG